MKVLVTGGAGYIGSHTCVALVQAGLSVVVVDNFSNSSRVALERAGQIVGSAIPIEECDVRDLTALDQLFARGKFDGVVHFAALKAVGESMADPLRYFDNNISGTVCLLQAMKNAGVRRIVFSSSATVYGEAESQPVTEDSPLSVSNPYGRTKLVMEQLIGDVCRSDPGFRAMYLRYFNPVGAHPSGLIGEDPRGVPNNLMPYIAQVAVGRRPQLQVFGGDWPTRDGTGVRDYLHVVDLAEAHVAAMHYIADGRGGVDAVNLGTGRGTTVLELVREFERASGREIPFRIEGRRPGDVAELWADPTKASSLFGWRANRSLEDMCSDAWRWQSMNPHGYRAR